MRKHLKHFFGFARRFLKKHQEAFKQAARYYPLRIVAMQRFPLSGETFFTVQFVGKSTCIKVSADQLANDDDLIRGFSPFDVKQIMEASLVKKKLAIVSGGKSQEAYRIISKHFERDDAEPSYTVEKTQGSRKTTEVIKLQEVMQSTEVLLKFSKQDIYEIAYTAGENSIMLAQNDINRLKQK